MTDSERWKYRASCGNSSSFHILVTLLHGALLLQLTATLLHCHATVLHFHATVLHGNVTSTLCSCYIVTRATIRIVIIRYIYSGLWRIVADCSGLWRIVADCSGLLRIVADCSGLWRIVVDCGGLWRIMVYGSERFLPKFGRFQRISTTFSSLLVTDCSGLWRIMADCGEL